MSCCFKAVSDFVRWVPPPPHKFCGERARMPTTGAFDAAAELSRNDKSGKVPTESILRGYGLYKVVTAGVGACPLHTMPYRHRVRRCFQLAPSAAPPKSLHGPSPCLAGPDAADCPNVLNVLAVERRQKWLAHEAAWEACGGNLDKAQELYVTHTEQCQGLEPGSLSK